jgi:hypothetical protein
MVKRLVPRRKEDGMNITSKYAGKCKGCGGAIAVGEQIEWARDTGARHTRCESNRRSWESNRRSWGAARGMGAGHGSAAPVRGYSSYCTDNSDCGCYDCAS